VGELRRKAAESYRFVIDVSLNTCSGGEHVMLSAVHGPASASPLVSLSLEHISRTSAAQLGITYQIVPAYVLESEAPADPEAAPGIVLWYQTPLGVGLYLDSLLGGGVAGQPLPLDISVSAAAAPATTIDIVA
jgi:hypothetical protein